MASSSNFFFFCALNIYILTPPCFNLTIRASIISSSSIHLLTRLHNPAFFQLFFLYLSVSLYIQVYISCSSVHHYSVKLSLWQLFVTVYDIHRGNSKIAAVHTPNVKAISKLIESIKIVAEKHTNCIRFLLKILSSVSKDIINFHKKLLQLVSLQYLRIYS